MPARTRSAQRKTEAELPYAELLCLEERKSVPGRPATSEMQDYFRIRRHVEPALLYQEGEPCGLVHLIASGRVRLTAKARGNESTLVELLGPGEFFGNLDGLADFRCVDSALVEPLSEIWTIDENLFQLLIHSRASVAQEFLHSLSARMMGQKRRLFWHANHDVPMRLARALVELTERFGVPHPKTGEYALPGISQQDLADYIGSVRTFISTILTDLRRAGIVTLLHRTLFIQNRRHLYEIAGLPMPAAATTTTPEAAGDDDSARKRSARAVARERSAG